MGKKLAYLFICSILLTACTNVKTDNLYLRKKVHKNILGEISYNANSNCYYFYSKNSKFRGRFVDYTKVVLDLDNKEEYIPYGTEEFNQFILSLSNPNIIYCDLIQSIDEDKEDDPFRICRIYTSARTDDYYTNELVQKDFEKSW